MRKYKPEFSPTHTMLTRSFHCGFFGHITLFSLQMALFLKNDVRRDYFNCIVHVRIRDVWVDYAEPLREGIDRGTSISLHPKLATFYTHFHFS